MFLQEIDDHASQLIHFLCYINKPDFMGKIVEWFTVSIPMIQNSPPLRLISKSRVGAGKR